VQNSISQIAKIVKELLFRYEERRLGD